MTDTRTITDIDVLDFMRTLDGEATNPHSATGANCIYTENDGTPSCLVGVVLDHFNLPRPEWDTKLNSQAASTLLFGGTVYMGPNVPSEHFDAAPEYAALTDGAKQLLIQAQQYADDGVEWGYVVDAAAVDLGLVDA